jgi:signal transduction histidine kinase
MAEKERVGRRAGGMPVGDPVIPGAMDPSHPPEEGEVHHRVAALEQEARELRGSLLAAEARFQSTVAKSVDGVIVLDAAGRVRFANAAAERLFVRDGAALIGLDFGFPAVAGEATEIDVLQPGQDPLIADMRVAETTWDGEGALLVLIRDVTERRAAEERERELIREQAARAEAEAHARRAELLDRSSRSLGATLNLDELLRRLAGVIVEELADVCVIDIDDQNGPMRRLAAARRDFPQRSLLKGLEDQPVRLGLHTAEARVLQTGESALIPLVTDDWLATATHQDDPAGAFVALHPCSLMMVTLYAGSLRWGVVTMMTCDPSKRYGPADLSLAEELVRRAGINLENARLFRFAQEASRAKSDFLAIVSHELRTPLSAIIGYTGLLEEGIAGDLNEKQRDYLSSVRKSADHLIGLIEQVITFARLEGAHERVRVEPVELARLVRDIGTLTRPLADRKGLTLTLAVPDGVTFSSDGKKIAQILVNLVTNAIKYTDAGEVRVEADLADDEVVLRVRDTGRGIPPDKVGVIFEPFHQLEDPRTRKEGGTGIGLSIVKNLTQLLGGEVGVAGRPGGGSTFTVRLPLLRAEKPAD